MTRALRPLIAAAAGLLFATQAAAEANRKFDRHAGYYYPVPQSREVYTARAKQLPDSSRIRRLAFVTALTSQMLKNPYPPPFAMFAKGTEAEKMIIVAVNANAYNTLYRARALLAQLTAVARMTPIFREYQVEDLLTFFDLAKMLGYTQITVSDGDKFAHRINIR